MLKVLFCSEVYFFMYSFDIHVEDFIGSNIYFYMYSCDIDVEYLIVVRFTFYIGIAAIFM